MWFVSGLSAPAVWSVKNMGPHHFKKISKSASNYCKDQVKILNNKSKMIKSDSLFSKSKLVNNQIKLHT